jgi:hypothetical protein
VGEDVGGVYVVAVKQSVVRFIKDCDGVTHL